MTPAQRRLYERRIIGHGRNGPIYAIAGGSVDAPETGAPTLPYTLEDLRGKTPEELQKIVTQLDEVLRNLHQTPEGELRILDEHEQRAMTLGLEIRKQAIGMLEEHARIAEVFRTKPRAVQTPLANLIGSDDDPGGTIRGLSSKEARDRALRVLDSRDAGHQLTAPQKDEVERQIRRDPSLARRLLVTENDAYRNAWMKAITDPQGPALWTEDERRAMQAWGEYRAMAENTTTAGGFGIPVLIDPSIILTAQETDNPFLQLARQVPVNTNIWKGVSSAGVTWAFQTEAATTTDNSPTLAQPSVTVHMARGFIPFSIEVGQDYPGFAEEMSTLLAAGYDELLVDKFTRGSGSGEPQGILTALSANTNVRVVITAAPSIGAGDPYKVWNALPQKYRRTASWLMDVSVNSAIRQLGTSTQFHAFTGTLREEWLDVLFRKAVYESPYMPGTTTTTAATSGYAIVGNFQNYLIARRGGMSVELVPQLFDVTTNRPTGQRGWFAYARIGGGSVNDLGFRLLVNA
jgi:HK97 family phage major capsid protein